jgi:hypothetical protein
MRFQSASAEATVFWMGGMCTFSHCIGGISPHNYAGVLARMRQRWHDEWVQQADGQLLIPAKGHL